MSDSTKIYKIAKDHGIAVVSLSWGKDFMVFGNNESIDEITRLLRCEARLFQLEKSMETSCKSRNHEV